MTRIRWAAGEYTDALQLRAQGKDFWEIADILNAKYYPDRPITRSEKAVKERLSYDMSQRGLAPGWAQGQELELAERVGNNETAAQIGRMMDKSRNAIIGKCRRMGISLTGDRADGMRMPPKARVKLARKSCEKPPVSPEEANKVSQAHKPTQGAIRGIPDKYQCKYPVSGTGVETIYCENRRTDKSYCEPHQEICYTASRY